MFPDGHLEQWLSGGHACGRISSTDVFTLLNLPVSARSQETNDRVGKAMRVLGWERKRLRFVKGGDPIYGYVKGDKVQQRSRINVRMTADQVPELYRGELNADEIF